MVRFKRKKNKGFTLIELLIVIAVIAVLVAILVPNFKSMRMEAKESKAKGDLKNLQTAVIIYVNRNGVFPATGPTSPSLDVLLNERPENRAVNSIPVDPFGVSPAKYGFLTNSNGNPSTDGDIASDAFYIIYSIGRDASSTSANVQTSLRNAAQNDSVISLTGTEADNIYVTNAKIP